MIEHTDDPLIFNHGINRSKYAMSAENDRHCPFCDVASLVDILRTEDDKIWLMNKFPTIEKAKMTVLIESKDHEGDISTSGEAENRSLFRFAFACWEEMLSNPLYRSVLMFKNFGPRSGGTLRHPHLQIIGLEEVDGYEHISAENFAGYPVKVKKGNNCQVTLSTKPIMGTAEMNCSIESAAAVNDLADVVRQLTRYLLHEFMNGRCDSYNLFFYRLGERYICKIVPRFITSPYFIGYKIPQVGTAERLSEVVKEMETFLE